MLWAVFTLIAAAAQTARNAMQRELTATLGTVGATHVRFLFGFPFAIVFLFGVMTVVGEGLPRPPALFSPWVIAGAFTQVSNTRSTVVGLLSGALFGMSAISYRGAILTLHLPDFVLAATFTVTVGLVIQAAVLSLYLWLGERKVMRDIM